ncbi:MAG: hypothetical protein A2538_02970 [Candidatus Magasanikbacteria bacterium RIFOXYD2_FULL_41_14]|uniref:Guanylate kinase-like domain-containing protein n=1 Tax=Candidatus Magasanikbacteria bacterium RIFOXYD2_FULL_41_14 TaxID=1798709 RepID=A0A1F6PCN0_9BACT|nr:MAG: hypothetical protein A2538_02970 [Candidatus Magasanikbacteria bacterium RIFOXYD2_FULL_41_14]
MQIKRGLLVIISSPSGGGKDTVIDRLLKIFPNSTRLINTTTRVPRPKDTPGVTYDFISNEQFKTGLSNKEYLEHNFYNGYYYGVNNQRLNTALAEHDLVFTNIDVNGRKSAADAGVKNLSIFLLPDDLKNLRTRIAGRGGLDETQINERLETAKREIARANEYDFQVKNIQGKLDETVAKVTEIIKKII